MTQATQSPLRPVMVSALPVLYSPRIAEDELGPERKRTYMALICPGVPSAWTGALLSSWLTFR